MQMSQEPCIIFGFSTHDCRLFLDLFHHGQRKLFGLFASVLLGIGARAIDTRAFEQMEQQGYGPRSSEIQDLDHLELCHVLVKRRGERSRL